MRTDGRGVCAHMADSLCHTTEANVTLKAIIVQFKKTHLNQGKKKKNRRESITERRSGHQKSLGLLPGSHKNQLTVISGSEVVTSDISQPLYSGGPLL